MKTNQAQLTALCSRLGGGSIGITMKDWNNPFAIPSHLVIMANLVTKCITNAGDDLDLFTNDVSVAYVAVAEFVANMGFELKPEYFSNDKFQKGLATQEPEHFSNQSARVAHDILMINGLLITSLAGWSRHQTKLLQDPDAPVSTEDVEHMASALVRTLVALDHLCTKCGGDIHEMLPMVVNGLTAISAIVKLARKIVGTIEAAPNN